MADLTSLLSYTDPDILILTETNIDSTIEAAEFLPEGDSRKYWNQSAMRDDDHY